MLCRLMCVCFSYIIGCLLPTGVDNTPSCILVLYGLEKVQVANMIGGLAEHLEHRGDHHSFYVPGRVTSLLGL